MWGWCTIWAVANLWCRGYWRGVTEAIQESSAKDDRVWIESDRSIVFWMLLPQNLRFCQVRWKVSGCPNGQSHGRSRATGADCGDGIKSPEAKTGPKALKAWLRPSNCWPLQQMLLYCFCLFPSWSHLISFGSMLPSLQGWRAWVRVSVQEQSLVVGGSHQARCSQFFSVG